MVETPRDRGSQEQCQSKKVFLFCHRLSDRNFGCTRQPYLIFSHFSNCCQNALPPRAPDTAGAYSATPAGKRWVTPLQIEGPTELWAPGPRAPMIRYVMATLERVHGMKLVHNREPYISSMGPFKCYVTLFSWNLDPHPPPS